MALITTAEECAQCGQTYFEESPFGGCPRCVFKEAMAAAPADHRPDSPGDECSSDGYLPQIENYTLLKLIGEGGFAKVYRARETGDFPRIVALKVLKRGMDTERIIERFAIERRTLAAMEHPNIATVLGGGETVKGRPYFVMELVEGKSVIEFSKENSLPLRQRLNLFIDICHGVQHAHQKGVIHRDLKPGNILVTSVDGHLVPKVIDFGIAKALDWDGESEAATRVGECLGTPAYMSPEQLNPDREDVDTRTDVYSLGIVLYELLTGVPYTSRSASNVSTVEVLDIQNEDARRKLSSKVVEKILNRRLRSELDWVVDKALESDPSQRYQSVSAMAEDVQCYLSGQPVKARSTSSLYLIRKAVGRHKKGLAIVAGFCLILCAGVFGVIWNRMKALQAQQEREAITVLFKDLRDVMENRLGNEDLQKQVSVTIGYYDDLKNSGSLVPTKTVRVFYSDLWTKLGNSYRNQGESKRARIAYSRALAEREALLKEFPDDAGVVSILSGVYASLAKVSLMELAVEEAVSHYRSALKLNRKCLELTPNAPKFRNNLAATSTSLGICLYQIGEVEASRQSFQEAIRIRRKLARGFDDASQQRGDLSYSLFFYAVQMLETSAETVELTGLVDEVLRVYKQRVKKEPDQLGRLEALGKILRFRAEVALSDGDVSAAFKQLKEAESFWIKLGKRDGMDDRITFQNELSRTRIQLAMAALSNDEPESARRALAAVREKTAGELEPPFMSLRFHLVSAALAISEESWTSADGEMNNAETELARLSEVIPRHPLLNAFQLELKRLRSLCGQQRRKVTSGVIPTTAAEPRKGTASHHPPALL
ncbi:MAG: serine/threonine protein kinase/tetratricopeptide (TPR) repeat protein [Verrucomicrobiales bacterium]|jgi:serine/threonine protein kinase/tetratricopeptide (TPR) repeat protein